MTDSDDNLLYSIAARATPLLDRALGEIRSLSTFDRRKANDRLERWRDLFGGASILEHRLKGRDLSSPVVKHLLSGVHRHTEIPRWACILRVILRWYSLSPSAVQGDEHTCDRSYDVHEPLPFQEILMCFVQHAREQLEIRAGSALQILRLPARAALERQLLAHITFVASLAVGRDFYEFRFERAPVSAMESIWCGQETSSGIYREYVRHMRNGGLIQLLDTYPVVARLLCQAVEQWTSAAANFCNRFSSDFSELRTFFGWGVERAEGAVAQLRTDLSDRHRDGQTVVECILSTGERVVYKPRTVQPEVVFYRFIDWLNGRGMPLALKTIQVLDRRTHGWVESVPFAPCRSDGEVERFYTRVGMLLGVLYVLATTDVHGENMIASGEHPIVVDLETLLNEAVAERTDSQRLGMEDATSSEGASVLSTGILPRWQMASDDDDRDMSALGGDETRNPGIDLFEWQAINTDQMRLLKNTHLAAVMNHRVQLNERHPSALEYLGSLITGFREVYCCLLENREHLIKDKRMLCLFDDLELRILVRSTMTYTRLHLHLLHPEFLTDGILRSIELEWLARPLSTRAQELGARLVYEREMVAMEKLDVPHFSTSEWQNMEHTFDDEDMRRLFKKRDSRILLNRLENLSQSDYIKQVGIIEKAVRARFTVA